MKIIQNIKEFARTHRAIKSFTYGRPARLGAGNLVYPAVWVEDPIRARGDQRGAQSLEINVSILGQPGDEAGELQVQTAAFNIGLRLVHYLNEIRGATVTYSGLTLSEYYDDNAAGARFTLTVATAADLNLCADPFDPEGTLEKVSADLPKFDTEEPEGCEVFADKTGVLPSFTLR